VGRIPQSLFDVSLVLRQRIQAGVRSIRNSSLCFVCRFGSKRLSPRREIVWFFYGIFQSQLLKRQRLEFNVRLRRPISIILAASLAGCSWQVRTSGLASARTRVSVETLPFQYKNEMILVDVSINGHPAVFLLDTGAPYTYVDPSGLNFHLESRGSTPVTGPLGNGNQPVFFPKIGFGSQELDMPVIGLDLSNLRKECDCNAAGLLGMKALQTFSEFDVDLRTKKLTLKR
jgi:hypothetical protein